jgi:hypothetical protein
MATKGREAGYGCQGACNDLDFVQLYIHPSIEQSPRVTDPIDPQLLMLEPQIVRTRDRPAGSRNCPPQTTQNNYTRREPSGFEYEATEEAIVSRDRGDAEVRRAVVEVAVGKPICGYTKQDDRCPRILTAGTD